jgi:hypothetical protein
MAPLSTGGGDDGSGGSLPVNSRIFYDWLNPWRMDDIYDAVRAICKRGYELRLSTDRGVIQWAW